MKRLIFVSLFLFLLGARVNHAQSVGQTLQWDYTTDTLANINTYVTALKIDAAPAVQITPTCAQNGTNKVTCGTPVSLTAGAHTLVVTAIFNGQQASGSLNFAPGTPPATPVNLTIVIKVNVP